MFQFAFKSFKVQEILGASSGAFCGNEIFQREKPASFSGDDDRLTPFISLIKVHAANFVKNIDSDRRTAQDDHLIGLAQLINLILGEWEAKFSEGLGGTEDILLSKSDHHVQIFRVGGSV
ncbi:hypothetical protein BH11ARM2_BH11ARM2_21580 [soil metagenome]